jgi:hypothetical protein
MQRTLHVKQQFLALGQSSKMQDTYGGRRGGGAGAASE